MVNEKTKEDFVAACRAMSGNYDDKNDVCVIDKNRLTELVKKLNAR